MNLEKVSFYSVNLVCGVVPEIGCGSRSKPVLLELEDQPLIKEAWLNRSGTVVGVVWADATAYGGEHAESILKKHGLAPKLLTGQDRERQLNSLENDPWYKGLEVNRLSIEEAGKIARRVVDPLVDSGLLNPELANSMLADVEQYLQKELLELEDVKLLSQASYYDNWAKQVTRIAKKYLPEDKIPQFDLS